jgi:hypothetical protein
MGSLTAITQIEVERPAKSSAAVVTFLLEVLSGGDIAVPILEAQAREMGLLGKQQAITSSKPFKRAKRTLGIRSLRIGFGTNGRWFWGLKTASEVNARNIHPPVPDTPGTEDTYVVDHSWSRAPSENDRRAHEGVRADQPAEWMDGLRRMETRSTPRDVPALRWDQFVSDYRWFIRSPEKWAARAYKLGWSTSDLFACCSRAP